MSDSVSLVAEKIDMQLAKLDKISQLSIMLETTTEAHHGHADIPQ